MLLSLVAGNKKVCWYKFSWK